MRNDLEIPSFPQNLPTEVDNAQPVTTPECAPPPIIPNDEERIARLLNYQILDTLKDPAMDLLTEIAAKICDVPIALISLVDRDRVWFKSAYGISEEETPRKVSLCAHAIEHGEEFFIIPDTLQDHRFKTHPMVTGEPFIRYYAGAPLVDKDDFVLGVLCVIDRIPRELDLLQLDMLRKIAATVMCLLESHLVGLKVSRLLQLEKEVYNRLLQSSVDLSLKATTFDEALTLLMNHLDDNLGWLSGRIRNMQNGGTTGIYYNTKLPNDPELPLIWQRIDSRKHHSSITKAQTEFISAGLSHPEYSYLLVPVKIRNTLVALIELIYPDHRTLDKRIQDIFDIISINLATIAERELITVELQHQATHDALTGVANRDFTLIALETAIRDVDSLDPDSALLYFDIDGFKDVNDNFGHEAGDLLLQEVTQRLLSICRNNDTLGRLSGDEFILVARGINVSNGLIPLLQRIENTLSHSFLIADMEIQISASIGCAVLDRPDTTGIEMLKRAEEAMYLVKQGERQGYCIADEEILRKFKIRSNLDRKIRDAFRNDRFFVVFQPIVDLQHGTISGVETLLRMNDRDGTVVEACKFMKAIERTRYMAQIDARVFTDTLKNFSSGKPKALLARPGFRISFNMNPAILSTHGFARHCLTQLRENVISPHSIILEITETNLIPDNDDLHKNLSILRESGVLIALDDFGKGYSNLVQLATLPIDMIKIDKQFIRSITNVESAKNSILGAILGIGKNLGYRILAEGIEEKLQADYLQPLGCHYGQGYYFGRPMQIDELIHFLEQQGHLAPTPVITATSGG
jgi:diguanylate cyclase (GGDEF)-like protein